MIAQYVGKFNDTVSSEGNVAIQHPYTKEQLPFNLYDVTIVDNFVEDDTNKSVEVVNNDNKWCFHYYKDGAGYYNVDMELTITLKPQIINVSN